MTDTECGFSWEREAKQLQDLLYWSSGPCDENLALIEVAFLAVERRAKEECARIAWPHKYPCTAGSNTSAADAQSWAIAAAIRSTLPPTSKAE